jgi:hypothetical protein
MEGRLRIFQKRTIIQPQAAWPEESMKTAVGQMGVAGGHAFGEANNILIDERRAALPGAQGRDRGSLYILVEVLTQPPGMEPASLAAQLAGVVHQSFYGRRGSVTAGLQQAVREANHLLFEDNRNNLPGERQTAGISVAVLRDGDLFLAQAGPAAALISQGGRVARYPEESPWLDGPAAPAVPAVVGPDEQQASPLGDRSDVDVALSHVQVQPGDFVLLLETAAARCLPQAAWPAVLHAGRVDGAQAALDALLAEVPGCDFTALALALGDPISRPASVTRSRRSSPAGATEAGAPAAGRRDRPRAPSAAERLARLAAALYAGLSAVARPLVAAVALLLGLLPRLGRALLTFLRAMAPGSISTPHTAPPPERAPARQAPAPAAQPAYKPARPAARAAALPAARAPARAASGPAVHLRAHGDPDQKALVVVAVLIPIVVAIIVGVTLTRRRGSEADQNALWQQAQASWLLANSAADATESRTLLLSAQSSLETLLQRRPSRPEAVNLRVQVVARLDEMDTVKRIPALTELTSYPAGADLSRVVVQGPHVFVLDRAGGAVYHHQLDADQTALTAASRDAVLVRRGQQVGSIVAGDLVDMAWVGVDAGTVRARPSLVILESGGSLLEYVPDTDQLAVLALGGDDVRQFPKWVGSNAGRLYLIDTGANKVWRYAPTPDGYAGAPDDWLTTPVDFAGAVDAAVGDGIYLLYSDARVQKLVGGAPVDYQASGGNTPLSGPRALSTYPPDDTESVYIADDGNARIVQTGSDGSFIRQYRLALEAAPSGNQPDPLSQIAGLFVDGAAGRAFFTSGNKLYMAGLPE